jgi:hypothetical protein
VKQQHASTTTSILTTKSTYRSLSAQRLSERTVVVVVVEVVVAVVAVVAVVIVVVFGCYSDPLLAGRSGDQIPVRARFLHPSRRDPGSTQLPIYKE